MLPTPIDVQLLTGSTTLGESLELNSAKFHKSCKLKFGKEKLERALKKLNKSEATELVIETRSKYLYFENSCCYLLHASIFKQKFCVLFAPYLLLTVVLLCKRYKRI